MGKLQAEEKQNMLQGSIVKAVLVFFFPILIGTFFQQLYNTVDAAIVGRFAGKIALSSVGGSSAILVNFVVGFFTGLSSGCTVLLSQYFGAKEEKKLDEALHTSYAFAIAGGLLLGALGVLCSKPLLRLMNTPDEIMDGSALYLKVYFAGMVFVFIYNIGSAILRALGNSRMPLIFLITCTAINIVLDLTFVVVFQLSVLGVAVATLLSQAISAILVTEYLMHRTKEVKLRLRRIRISGRMLSRILRIGLPSGIQSSSYSVSNMVIQAAINMYGVTTVAGFTAEGKVDVLFWMINGSFGIACATFVGQNYGAGNTARVRKGTRTCLIMSVLTACGVATILLTVGKNMLWLFTTEQAVVDVAVHMMQLVVPTYFLFAFIEILSSSLRAQGINLIPTIINILSIVVFRVIWISIFGHNGNIDMVIYSYPLSWLICMIAIVIYYLYRRSRIQTFDAGR